MYCTLNNPANPLFLCDLTLFALSFLQKYTKMQKSFIFLWLPALLLLQLPLLFCTVLFNSTTETVVLKISSKVEHFENGTIFL